jgi:hypothetical protein
MLCGKKCCGGATAALPHQEIQAITIDPCQVTAARTD